MSNQAILKHASLDMGLTLSDILLVEVDPAWCRQCAEMSPTDIDLPIGAVLAVKADGIYVPYLASEADTEAVAMLITPLDASDKTQSCVVVKRGCVLAANNLFFIPAASAADKKKAALASLEERGLVPQE